MCYWRGFGRGECLRPAGRGAKLTQRVCLMSDVLSTSEVYMDDNRSDADAADRAKWINDRIDTTKPHPARVYDVFLGGRDNYPVDRAAAKAALAVNPRGYLNIWHNRDFVRRAVTHLAQDVR